ncbi:cytochrome P450 [Undibacterium sp. Ji50W]|uniref:cytochrome P450 n=1 Tax=Undibacterium sp. Ji50W TaxID=3413041 RepID=UPI003BF43DF8
MQTSPILHHITYLSSTAMTQPGTINILNAASHSDPYPYYASLRQGPALAYEAEFKCWVASRADVVQQVLESATCAVRPTAEPVPSAIAGGSAGEIFAHLMRMNEGQPHTQPKQVMQGALRKLDLSAIAVHIRLHAQTLSRQYALGDGQGLNQYLFDLPIHVMGSTLGFRQDALAMLATWMADFVRCLSPLSTPPQIEAAHAAAQALQAGFRQLLQDSAAKPDSFLARLQADAQQQGWNNADALLANLIGLLSQTYEATAGLVGNSIIALQQGPDLLHGLCEESAKQPQRIKDLVAEVARHDAPVQNTRRFVTQACEIAGQALQAGEVIVVLLAAANRDESANPDADSLQLDRPNRKVFSFGHARHACPGQAIAEQTSASSLRHLLTSSEIDWGKLSWTYRPSLNGRIPVFTHIPKETT